MNYNNKIIAPIIIIVAVCAAVIVLLFMRAPEYKDKTNILAAENELLKRDIDLVETEVGDIGNIDSDINELNANINAMSDGMSINSKNMKDSLSVICVDAGIEAFEVMTGVPETLQSAGEFSPALMRCDATITFHGEEGAGYGLIQGIEMSTDCDYEIVSFDYQKDEETNLIAVGDWTIVVAVYYFEETTDA